LIWDVDGTIAETERDGHRVAFNQAFTGLGVPWQWDVPTYGRLLRVTGGFERLIRDMEGRAQAPASAAERNRLARSVHRRKNQLYAEIVAAGGICIRPGVQRLMDECASARIALAIATTTSRPNVEALLSNLFGTGWQRFAAIVCADDAPIKKPDPMAYRFALERLDIAARDAMAVEDSPNGLAAARAIGIGTLITRSEYFVADTFPGCAGICDDLDSAVTWRSGSAARTDIAALRRMHVAWINARSSRTPSAPSRSRHRPGPCG